MARAGGDCDAADCHLRRPPPPPPPRHIPPALLPPRRPPDPPHHRLTDRRSGRTLLPRQSSLPPIPLQQLSASGSIMFRRETTDGAMQQVTH